MSFVNALRTDAANIERVLNDPAPIDDGGATLGNDDLDLIRRHLLLAADLLEPHMTVVGSFPPPRAVIDGVIHPDACPSCSGSGQAGFTWCRKCNGTGRRG